MKYRGGEKKSVCVCDRRERKVEVEKKRRRGRKRQRRGRIEECELERERDGGSLNSHYFPHRTTEKERVNNKSERRR